MEDWERETPWAAMIWPIRRYGDEFWPHQERLVGQCRVILLAITSAYGKLGTKVADNVTYQAQRGGSWVGRALDEGFFYFVMLVCVSSRPE